MKNKNQDEKYSHEEKENESTAHENDVHFDLPDKSKQYVNLNPKDEDLGKTGNLLQKLHLKNHSLSSKETIHEIYRPEEEINETETGLLSEQDEFIFNEVHNAVSEYDVINLRGNLQFILKSVSAHKYSIEEIDEFIDGEIEEELKLKIEEECGNNPNLADDIRLFKEINLALCEKDVIQIRTKLLDICDNESSHNHSVDEIDDYLSNEMEVQDKEAFEQEMLNNPGLAKDVKMHTEIAEAIRETDIIQFRENLNQISETEIRDDSNQKRGLTSLKTQKILWYAAASIVLMISLNFMIRSHSSSSSELYNTYFQPSELSLGTTRSASDVSEITLDKALVKMNQKDYDAALKLFSGLLNENLDNAVCSFYIGMIQQLKGNYDSAIQSFSEVIKQGDNLFIEQSNWYIGLCYLNRNEKEKAIRQFKKIARQKGYYQKRSEEILAKLE